MPHASRKSEKADASRGRVLHAAARLFREKGYASVNLRQIAAHAGMKAGSLYYHFDSKEAIVAEVLDAGIQAVHAEVRRAVESLPGTTPAAEVIRAAVRTHLRSLLHHSDYTSANVRIFGQVPPGVRKGNLKARRDYEALWEGILARAAARGAVRGGVDLRHAQLLLISALNATLEWFDPKRGDLDALADSYTDLLLHGLLRAPRKAA